MDGPPPPPPPHGANPKTTGGSGLPPGNYDIFIIPPHSSGGGFLYLPSLQPQRNSFAAGFATAVAAWAVWHAVKPTVLQWTFIIKAQVSAGGNPVMLLIAVVAIAGWGYQTFLVNGRGPGGSGPGNGPQGGAGGSASGAGYQRAQSPPGGGFPGAGAPPPQPQGHPGGGWYNGQQRGAPPPPPPQDSESSWSGSQPDPSANASWERAREETRQKEEERKKAEEERKKAEEAEKRRQEAEKRKEEERKKKEAADREAHAKAEKEKWEKTRARQKEAREREARERIAKERMQKEKEAREKAEQERQAREAEARAKIEKEIREKLEAEQKAKAEEEAKRKAAADKAAAEAAAAKAKADAEAAAAKAKADAERAERLKAARERAQKEREAREARVKAEAERLNSVPPPLNIDPNAGRRSTTYGGVGGGERTDPYAGARSPPAASVTSTHSSPIKVNISPKKKNYEKPSASSYVGTEDAHSFRPYDTPKRPPKPPSHQSSIYSESSYAPSQSTSRTTPPASQRGTYSTTDPDKIQIKAVYLFNDLYPKPAAQLVSGLGNVTDGLVLNIRTEGLFIDDDVRHVPQREWDVKAWTLKLVETGERNGTHILRASIRDQNNRKYVFIIDHSESWKVAIGLSRLKKGSQVRALATGQIAAAEMARLLGSVPLGL